MTPLWPPLSSLGEKPELLHNLWHERLAAALSGAVLLDVQLEIDALVLCVEVQQPEEPCIAP